MGLKAKISREVNATTEIRNTNPNGRPLMRSALKTPLLVLYNLVFVCAVFALAEYITRAVAYRQLGSPARQTELILDRWAAFRNNPAYTAEGVQLTREGFRRDRSVSLDKPPDTIRIFLLGGSVAYGGDTLFPEIDDHWRISNQQTIDYYLEQRLNSTFPGRHWEVVNAAVKGTFLNQDLAILLSAVQPYKPDYLLLLDGVNDMFIMIRSAGRYDGYLDAGYSQEFKELTDPSSLSLRMMLSTWLASKSAIYRFIHDQLKQRNQIRSRKEQAREADARPGAPRPTSLELRQYQAATAQFSNFAHTVRQIHRVAELDGVHVAFVLQPNLAVTRKQLTSVEKQLLDYWRKTEGTFVYGFEALYPELAKNIATDAETEGYVFLDLTAVFDHMTAQAFTDYCHLTPAADQAVADAIFDSLKGSIRGKIAAVQ
jgi:lysophospholipase L1-like esterase